MHFHIRKPMKFKKATITIRGKRVKGYRVINPGKVFRGLKIFVKRDFNSWYAYEATTGSPLTPSSWAGGYSNHTRAGVIQIIANKFANMSEYYWNCAQKKLNYTLKEGE